MKRIAALALVVLLAAPLTAQPALAEPGGPPRMQGQEGGGWDPMARLMEQLKLSPEQRGRLESIRARQKAQTRAQREELMRKRTDLFELIRSAKSTREQAVAKQREVDALQTRLAEARLTAWYEGRAVLTAEQLAQLERLPMGRGARGWKRHAKDGN
jgi:Spy/CpxP family protein refolding chaperone